MKIKFKKWNTELRKGKYENDRIALVLVDPKDPTEFIAVATVNVPEVRLTDNQVIIKDYSENEGMLKTLVEAEVVSSPIKQVRTGFTIVQICQLLINPDKISSV